MKFLGIFLAHIKNDLQVIFACVNLCQIKTVKNPVPLYSAVNDKK